MFFERDENFNDSCTHQVAHLAASLAQKDQLVIDLQATLKQLTEEHEATKCRLKELEVKYDGLKQDSHDALVGKVLSIDHNYGRKIILVVVLKFCTL